MVSEFSWADRTPRLIIPYELRAQCVWYEMAFRLGKILFLITDIAYLQKKLRCIPAVIWMGGKVLEIYHCDTLAGQPLKSIEIGEYHPHGTLDMECLKLWNRNQREELRD